MSQQLTVRVDGQERATREGRFGVRFELAKAEEVIEVIKGGRVLVTHLMQYDDFGSDHMNTCGSAEIAQYDCGSNVVSVIMPRRSSDSDSVIVDIDCGPMSPYHTARICMRSLNTVQYLKLRSYAQWRAKYLPIHLGSNGYTALLYAAAVRALVGGDIRLAGDPLYQHLIRLIGQVSDDWFGGSPVTDNERYQRNDPDLAFDPKEIRSRLAKDRVASDFFELLVQGRRIPEINVILSLSSTESLAVARCIRAAI